LYFELVDFACIGWTNTRLIWFWVPRSNRVGKAILVATGSVTANHSKIQSRIIRSIVDMLPC
jgi:hypothetical protein